MRTIKEVYAPILHATFGVKTFNLPKGFYDESITDKTLFELFDAVYQKYKKDNEDPDRDRYYDIDRAAENKKIFNDLNFIILNTTVYRRSLG